MTLPRLGYRDDTEADVSIDIDTLIGTRLLVQGVSGSGKSTAIRAMLEETHGRVQQLVIDREGEFATLREQLPYVLAGKEGDVPADVRTAKLLVRRMLELGASAIVDLSDLKIPEQREWVKRGFEELVHLPRELWHPLLVILDEGHMFAPERGSGESVATQAVIDVATLGRKRGYSLVVATQRLSKLHKDCAAELLNKFIGYTDDVDLLRAGDQLGMTKEQRAGLKRMEWGQFYVYGPAVWSDQGRVLSPILVRSPDPQTKPPARGQVRPPAPPAPAKIKKLLEQLQDLPQQAEEEARSVVDLQRQNRELQHRVKQLEKGAPAAAPVTKIQEVVKRVEVPVLKDGQLTRLETVSGNLVKAGELVVTVGRDITAALAKLQQPNGHPTLTQRVVKPAPRSREQISYTPRADSRPAPLEGGAAPLKKGAQRMLQALARLHPRPLTRGQIRTFAGMVFGGTFSDYLSKLRVNGYINEQGDEVTITAAGLEAAGPIDQVGFTTDELIQLWRPAFKAGAQRMLDVLLEHYPQSLDRGRLAELANVTLGGTFSDYLSKLRTAGLIDEKGKQVRLHDDLFNSVT